MPNITKVIRETGETYNSVMKMPFTVFLSLLRETYIANLQETDEGRKYLEDCKRLQVTTPDFKALRANQSYKGQVVE